MQYIESKTSKIDKIILKKSCQSLYSKNNCLFFLKYAPKIYNQNRYHSTFSRKHSSILLTVKLDKQPQRRRSLWNFNKPLLLDEDFVLKMKDHIPMSIEILNKENIFGDQMRYDVLKFEIRKFSIHCLISIIEKER